MVDINWFYIKHLGTNKTIASCSCQDDSTIDNDMPLMRSQVIVTKPTYSDNELWCWDDQQLRNKSTGLVLDIRKGKCSFLGAFETTNDCTYRQNSFHGGYRNMFVLQEIKGRFSESAVGCANRVSTGRTPIGQTSIIPEDSYRKCDLFRCQQ
ncbi:unnamed protein product [Mucor fragilis]